MSGTAVDDLVPRLCLGTQTLGAAEPRPHGINTVREIFLVETQDWGFALWSAGATLPLLPCEAMLRTVSVCSMAADQQSASRAGALHNCASGAQRSKFIPDSIGLVGQCGRTTRAACCPWHTDKVRIHATENRYNRDGRLLRRNGVIRWMASVAQKSPPINWTKVL